LEQQPDFASPVFLIIHYENSDDVVPLLEASWEKSPVSRLALPFVKPYHRFVKKDKSLAREKLDGLNRTFAET
jgi:hypothetical protein